MTSYVFSEYLVVFRFAHLMTVVLWGLGVLPESVSRLFLERKVGQYLTLDATGIRGI